MKFYILPLALLILTVTSCKRGWQHQYPEDNVQTKFTPKERIIKTEWHLSNATFNNLDYTDTIKKVFPDLEYYFGDEGDGNMWPYNAGWVSYDKDSIREVMPMWWKFGINEETIKLNQNYSNSSFIPGWLLGSYLDRESWTILKLTDKEFKIKIETISKDTIITNTYITY
jgi:hypothetical protein